MTRLPSLLLLSLAACGIPTDDDVDTELPRETEVPDETDPAESDVGPIDSDDSDPTTVDTELTDTDPVVDTDAVVDTDLPDTDPVVDTDLPDSDPVVDTDPPDSDPVVDTDPPVDTHGDDACPPDALEPDGLAHPVEADFGGNNFASYAGRTLSPGFADAFRFAVPAGCDPYFSWYRLDGAATAASWALRVDGAAAPVGGALGSAGSQSLGIPSADAVYTVELTAQDDACVDYGAKISLLCPDTDVPVDTSGPGCPADPYEPDDITTPLWVDVAPGASATVDGRVLEVDEDDALQWGVPMGCASSIRWWTDGGDDLPAFWYVSWGGLQLSAGRLTSQGSAWLPAAPFDLTLTASLDLVEDVCLTYGVELTVDCDGDTGGDTDVVDCPVDALEADDAGKPVVATVDEATPWSTTGRTLSLPDEDAVRFAVAQGCAPTVAWTRDGDPTVDATLSVLIDGQPTPWTGAFKVQADMTLPPLDHDAELDVVISTKDDVCLTYDLALYVDCDVVVDTDTDLPEDTDACPADGYEPDDGDDPVFLMVDGQGVASVENRTISGDDEDALTAWVPEGCAPSFVWSRSGDPGDRVTWALRVDDAATPVGGPLGVQGATSLPADYGGHQLTVVVTADPGVCVDYAFAVMLDCAVSTP